MSTRLAPTSFERFSGTNITTDDHSSVKRPSHIPNNTNSIFLVLFLSPHKRCHSVQKHFNAPATIRLLHLNIKQTLSTGIQVPSYQNRLRPCRMLLSLFTPTTSNRMAAF